MGRQYHKSVFAFLDLLGVKEKINNDNGDFLAKLGSIYDSTLRIYKSVWNCSCKESKLMLSTIKCFKNSMKISAS